MKELIEYIALALVDDPTKVSVQQGRDSSQIRLNLQVAKDDMGRIIGKAGKVANSMRILLRVAAAREGKQATLDIVEPR